MQPLLGSETFWLSGLSRLSLRAFGYHGLQDHTVSFVFGAFGNRKASTKGMCLLSQLRAFYRLGLKDSAGLLAWLDSVNFEPTRFGQHFHGQGVVNQSIASALSVGSFVHLALFSLREGSKQVLAFEAVHCNCVDTCKLCRLSFGAFIAVASTTWPRSFSWRNLFCALIAALAF